MTQNAPLVSIALCTYNGERYLKRQMLVSKKSPLRRLVTCRIHSWISLSKTKRLKWRAKADGIKAYLQGTKAFDESGRPMMSPKKH